MGTTPLATQAAEPPLDPPGVRSRSQGFRVVGELLDQILQHHRHAGEGSAEQAGGDLGSRPIGQRMDDRVELWVHDLETVEGDLEQFGGSGMPIADEGRLCRRVHPANVDHGQSV